VFAVSEQERSYFSNIGSSAVRLVPNGVDCSKFAELPTGRTWTDPNVVFVGSLSWPPNVAAAQFLAREVHPRVLQRWPNARLTIVGRDPGPEVRALAAGQSVHLADNVPDITPYLADASLLAVPLATGGGTRHKILESFAAGLPVVSTPVGCEGIAAVDGRELIVALAHFVNALVVEGAVDEQ
jgi:glycosyltransferase involved in cell wall biosynthesis